MTPDSAAAAEGRRTPRRLRRPGAGGFQGRCNKDADTCYSFWIGGTLDMLGAFDMVDTTR